MRVKYIILMKLLITRTNIFHAFCWINQTDGIFGTSKTSVLCPRMTTFLDFFTFSLLLSQTLADDFSFIADFTQRS